MQWLIAPQTAAETRVRNIEFSRQFSDFGLITLMVGLNGIFNTRLDDSTVTGHCLPRLDGFKMDGFGCCLQV